MLSLGRLRSRTCQGLTRRAVLQIGASSVFGLSLADLLRVRAEGGERLVGTAKSVLLLWMWGGPSHLDTWDPKPNAAFDYRGPFGSIATKTPGIRIGELFPKIAQLSDRFAILRSLHTGSSDHGVAGTIGLTGSPAGGVGLDGKPLPSAVRPTPAASCAVRGGDRNYRPSSWSAADSIRARKPSSAKAAGLSAPCTIPFGWNTTRFAARAFRRCNCPTTSRRNAWTTANACSKLSTNWRSRPTRRALSGH